MIVILTVRRNGRVDICIVLEQQNIDRIKDYDPAGFDWSTLPTEYSTRRPQTIAITFATNAEHQQILEMSASDPDWKAKALKLLSKNFKFRPELGDNDFGPVTLGEPTKGVKQ